MSIEYTTMTKNNPTLSTDEGHSVSVTDHALNRWRERTPADREIDIREAWRRGDAVRHPDVVSTGCDADADEARVFVHPSGGWSAIFVVVVDHHPEEWGRVIERAVTTILVIRQYDHEPTRQYLWAYGPHGGESC